MSDLVSIITPAYNSEKYIEDAIKSVQSQKHTNYEHIIIDDGSVDSTVDIVKRLMQDNPKIILLCLDKNYGSGVARNEGLKEAKGRYISFLDSDDFWHTEKLHKQIQCMQEQRVPLVYSQYFLVREPKGNLTHIVRSPSKVNYSKMLVNDYIGFSTMIYDSEVLGKQFLPNMRSREDWVLKLKLLEQMDFAVGIQEPLVYYRIGHPSLTSNKISLIRYNFKVFHEILGFSTVKSLLYLTNLIAHNILYKLISRKKVQHNIR